MLEMNNNNSKHDYKEYEVVGAKAKEKFCKREVKYPSGSCSRKGERLKVSSVCVQFWAVVATIIALLTWVFTTRLSYSQSSYFQSPPADRIHWNNGYLMISCNGGLNQMRIGICDMVAVARYLNLTLIVPELSNASFWNDNSQFADIFNVDHFITSLRDEVRVLKELPPEQKRKAELESIYSMYPLRWVSLRYYLDKILPRVQRHEVLRFTMTDYRLANNGIPKELQKLRCRVNFEALKFTTQIEETGRKIVKKLKQKGPFLALHLRYEKDVLAFTGCTDGCSDKETKELTEMRHAHSHWKNTDATKHRRLGLCPLTPEETTVMLQGLGIDHNMQIYIAAGETYGNSTRMASLREAYPNLVRKENLLEAAELQPFQNHLNQMAALDYIVAIESDIFLPTYNGNMAKVVEGHRRYLGFKTTILPNKKLVVSLINQYKEGKLSWDEFSILVKESHKDRMGKPKRRLENPEQPKKEDYFYSNPQECLPPFSQQNTQL